MNLARQNTQETARAGGAAFGYSPEALLRGSASYVVAATTLLEAGQALKPASPTGLCGEAGCYCSNVGDTSGTPADTLNAVTERTAL
jgi:hypothetical protein